MLHTLFLAAVEAHGAVSGAAEPGIAEKFGLEPKFIVLQGISFIILFAVLYKFGIKPTISAMEERQQKIDAGLKYAENMKVQLAATQQQSEAAVKAAQVQAQQIIVEAQKSAKEFIDKQHKEALERANGLITKAQQSIDLEHKKMLADARNEIARLVVSTTERVLAKKLSDADRASYNESAARELASV